MAWFGEGKWKGMKMTREFQRLNPGKGFQTAEVISTGLRAGMCLEDKQGKRTRDRGDGQGDSGGQLLTHT